MVLELDESQQRAWDLFVDGKNVGLFGRAGCGKSAVLTEAISYAKRRVGADRVAVVAWTTHAASLIGGSTFHKFLSIGIAELPKEVVLSKVRGNIFTRSKVNRLKLIVVDEVPQFASRWFAVFEYVVRQLAPRSKHAQPWGGVQLVGALSVSFGMWALLCAVLCAVLTATFTDAWAVILLRTEPSCLRLSRD